MSTYMGARQSFRRQTAAHYAYMIIARLKTRAVEVFKMASLDTGKEMIIQYLKENFPAGSVALDVGACDGKYYDLLGDHFTMDAVEIFAPNVETHRLREKYRYVFVGDIMDYNYHKGDYDVAIFGDVIEHMTIAEAQHVLEKARKKCKEVIVAVPYMWPQGALYGNQHERHLQPDLTPELFEKRYPGFTVMYKQYNYGYYRKS